MSKKEKYFYWFGYALMIVWQALLLLLFLGFIYFSFTKQPLWTVVCAVPTVLIVSTFFWANCYSDFVDQELEELIKKNEDTDESEEY